MLLKVNNVRLFLLKNTSLRETVAERLDIKEQQICSLKVLRRAVDARRKANIAINYHVLVELEDNTRLLKKLLRDKDIEKYREAEAVQIECGAEPLAERPVVIGAGPAGLLAALELAMAGYKPLLLERGKPLAERVKDVNAFWSQGSFNPSSNVQFGEGGAGTFSDGKLTTRVNDPLMGHILKLFVEAGAPQEILWEQKPHVGSDKLRAMVTGLADKIRANGGEIVYNAQVTDFIFANGCLCGLKLNNGATINTEVAVLACGHSARDTYAVLKQHGVAMQAKAFAIGLRIEHPQELIDRAQYGDFAGHSRLGHADYALVHHTQDKKRTAYSFCMCPGGKVVGAASETGGMVVNGMSMYKRDSGIANSALVVNVGPEDFGSDPMAGVLFQRHWEQLAFKAAGGGYCAPAQNVDSFLSEQAPSLQAALQPTCLPGVKACALSELLPEYVATTLKEAIAAFGSRLNGFADKGALLTGVETRTSAPLRIIRGDNYMSLTHKGLYPCGEGAGYAGGIMSAALDGYHTAAVIISKYAPF